MICRLKNKGAGDILRKRICANKNKKINAPDGLKTGGTDKMEAYKKEFIEILAIFHFYQSKMLVFLVFTRFV